MNIEQLHVILVISTLITSCGLATTALGTVLQFEGDVEVIPFKNNDISRVASSNIVENGLLKVKNTDTRNKGARHLAIHYSTEFGAW